MLKKKSENILRKKIQFYLAGESVRYLKKYVIKIIDNTEQ